MGIYFSDSVYGIRWGFFGEGGEFVMVFQHMLLGGIIEERDLRIIETEFNKLDSKLAYHFYIYKEFSTSYGTTSSSEEDMWLHVARDDIIDLIRNATRASRITL
jgi:hypothetical protein